VLASACLPTIHHAVTIDGQAYWDGGFSANPDLVTLGRESPVGDTLIVKLSTLDSNGVPTSAREIAGRINQITFMQPMLRDVEVIEAVRRRYSLWTRPKSAADARLARHRFHLIEAGRFTGSLAPESRTKPDMELLTYLFGAGRSETEKWLARHRDSIGRTESVDLRARFLETRSPAPAPAFNRASKPGSAP
jgi:NTE family protein